MEKKLVRAFGFGDGAQLVDVLIGAIAVAQWPGVVALDELHLELAFVPAGLRLVAVRVNHRCSLDWPYDVCPEDQVVHNPSMAFELEQQDALHLLRGIEEGTLATSEAAHRIENADPVLVYFIVTWLRTRYSNHPAAEGVLGRLVEIGRATSKLDAKFREGKTDSLVEWFEDEHEYQALDATDFIRVVVEKLES